MATQLHGKLILLSSSGAGRALPFGCALALRGAHLVLAARDAEPLAPVAAALPRAEAISADPERNPHVRRLAAELDRRGGCDLVIHDMGGDAAEDAIPAFLRVMRLTQALLPRMQRKGGGQIVFADCPPACEAPLRSFAEGVFRAGRGARSQFHICPRGDAVPLLAAAGIVP